MLVSVSQSDASNDMIQESSSGGPGQSDKKSSDNVFFFLVLSLFYRSEKFNF